MDLLTYKKLFSEDDAVGWDAENAQYTGVQKPVKWTRIHNLPDHVYFNPLPQSRT